MQHTCAYDTQFTQGAEGSMLTTCGTIDILKFSLGKTDSDANKSLETKMTPSNMVLGIDQPPQTVLSCTIHTHISTSHFYF